jgi:hypothetical protein
VFVEITTLPANAPSQRVIPGNDGRSRRGVHGTSTLGGSHHRVPLEWPG